MIRSLLTQLKKNSFVKESFAYVFATVLIKSINFLTTPIFTRMMNTSDFGLVNNFTLWAQMIAVIICAQLTSSLVTAKYSFAEKRFDNYVASVFRASIKIAVIASGIILLLQNYLAKLFSINQKYIGVLCIYAFGICLSDMFSSYCIATNRVQSKVIFSIVSSAFNVCLGIVFVVIFENKSEGRIIAYLINYLVISIILLFFFFRKPLEKNKVKKDVRYALKYGLPLIPHLIANMINGNIDRVCIIKYMDESHAGIYSVAYTIGLIAFVVADGCNAAWVPWFAKKNKDDEYSEISTMVQLYSVTLGMCFFGVIMLAPELIQLMSGADYQGGVCCIRYIAVGVFFMFMYRFSVNYEQLSGNTKYVATATIAAAGLNLILNTFFIPKYGIIGAALATTLSYFFLWMFHEIVARKIIKGYKVKVKYYVLSCIVVGIGFWASEPLLDRLSYRIIIIIIMCVLYGVWMLCLMRRKHISNILD